jgi:outer membrane protein assembly factor BamB
MRPAANSKIESAIYKGLGLSVILIVAFIAWYEFSARRSHSVQSAPAIPEKWEFTEARLVSAALALAPDGTLYAASQDGFVYAVDSSGNLKWKFSSGPDVAAPVIGPDGTIYVSNSAEVIYAINPSGTQQWTAGAGAYADKDIGKIAMALDQNFLYASVRGQLRGIRLDTGGFSWITGYGFQRNGAVSILPTGLVAYPGVGRLDAADSSGRMAWEYPVQNPPLTPDILSKNGGHVPQGNFWLDCGIAVGGDGTLYVCAANSRVVAFGSDGTYKWEFKSKQGSQNHATPVIAADGTIYVASGDGYLYALNPDASPKWSFEAGDAIVATPALAQDGTIYVVNGSALIAVSPEGKLLAKSIITGGAESSPTLGPDGTLYVATRERKIIAFAATHGALMESPWPKFHHDNANTARARPF